MRGGSNADVISMTENDFSITEIGSDSTRLLGRITSGERKNSERYYIKGMKSTRKISVPNFSDMSSEGVNKTYSNSIQESSYSNEVKNMKDAVESVDSVDFSDSDSFSDLQDTIANTKSLVGDLVKEGKTKKKKDKKGKKAKKSKKNKNKRGGFSSESSLSTESAEPVVETKDKYGYSKYLNSETKNRLNQLPDDYFGELPDFIRQQLSGNSGGTDPMGMGMGGNQQDVPIGNAPSQAQMQAFSQNLAEQGMGGMGAMQPGMMAPDMGMGMAPDMGMGMAPEMGMMGQPGMMAPDMGMMAPDMGMGMAPDMGMMGQPGMGMAPDMGMMGQPGMGMMGGSKSRKSGKKYVLTGGNPKSKDFFF